MGGKHDILQIDLQLRIDYVDFQRLHLDQVPEPPLQCRLDGELQSGAQLGTVGCEHQLHQPAAEIRLIHPFSGIGEKQLLDHVEDMALVGRPGGAAGLVDAKWKANVHKIQNAQVANTFVCVAVIRSGVPEGAQMATLS